LALANNFQNSDQSKDQKSSSEKLNPYMAFLKERLQNNPLTYFLGNRLIKEKSLDFEVPRRRKYTEVYGMVVLPSILAKFAIFSFCMSQKL